ncbi:arrestin domain-containing protein 3-like [Copidosoma floridanum]|uniref:arrestin domain-containing protein 3-like n=1 Tax=Copidosoma floridanum TaxID=29053 RepID=UPI0006C98CBA|nr:arrestin domain-containing protein 3-like [Copidosoma floridanum]XP_014210819.1 arrestin domain-containing protein 3-like [Copidosoma floridanum]
MDNISEFDIKLEKEIYYAGEVIHGHVILHTTENFKLRSMRLSLRGQAHAEWKISVSGDRRSVKDDQYFVDERIVVWGHDSPEGPIPILPRGKHKFPFTFNLPESALPYSFESRTGYIRYYVKATVDRPYASPPQGLKYFTLIGPHIDCMDEHYLKPTIGTEIQSSCFCCRRNPVELSAQLERSAYVCGESIKLRASIDNRGIEKAWLHVALTQHVEFFIERGVLGASKEIQKVVMEYKGEPVVPGTAVQWDSSRKMILPICPPSLLGVCRLIRIYYVLKVSVQLEKSGEDMQMYFPITVATVPFRIPNLPHPKIKYEMAVDHVEGGCYVGPEFLLGQVYDGTDHLTSQTPLVLYRPVYVCIASEKKLQNQ